MGPKDLCSFNMLFFVCLIWPESRLTQAEFRLRFDGAARKNGVMCWLPSVWSDVWYTCKLASIFFVDLEILNQQCMKKMFLPFALKTNETIWIIQDLLHFFKSNFDVFELRVSANGRFHVRKREKCRFRKNPHQGGDGKIFFEKSPRSRPRAHRLVGWVYQLDPVGRLENSTFFPSFSGQKNGLTQRTQFLSSTFNWVIFHRTWVPKNTTRSVVLTPMPWHLPSQPLQPNAPPLQDAPLLPNAPYKNACQWSEGFPCLYSLATLYLHYMYNIYIIHMYKYQLT